MIWLGPVLGVLMGFVLAGGGLSGVIGALVGAWLGRRFDLIVQLSEGLYFVAHRHSSERGNLIQSAFFQAVFVCLGRVAKCDGVVSEEEIDWAKAVMERMGLSPEKRFEAVALFERGKAFDHDPGADLKRLLEACGRRRNLIHIFLEILVQCGLADGSINAREWAVLQSVAASLKVSPRQLEAMVRAAQAFQQYSAKQNDAVSVQDRLLDAYAILCIPPDASLAEIKRAYRRQMSRNHPDKLAANGLPDEMLVIAKQKTQAIQAAYAEIQQIRR